MDITARYIDTCLSDYLQDGYTREGQTLCLASLGGLRDLTVDDLYDSIDWDSGLPDAADLEDRIRAALTTAIADVDLRYIDENGDRCDETPDARDSEEPYIYVVLEWDPTIIKVQMTVDVEYWVNGEDRGELAAHVTTALEVIIMDAAGRGDLTADCKALVKSWGATATEVKEHLK